MGRDSLTNKLILNLKTQPKTVRGWFIDWYASQKYRSHIRITIILIISIIVMAHTIAFSLLLKDYLEKVFITFILH